MKTKNFFYALSVAVCLLGVSTNAWAYHDKHFFQGDAQVAGLGLGKVYVQQTAITDINNVTEESWASNEYVTDVLNCEESGDNDYLYFCAKPNDGSHFWGWYEDEACTEVMDDEPEMHANILKIDASGSTDESSPNVVTRYAKFSNEPYPYHWYYATLTAKTDPADGTKGRVQANTYVSDDGHYGNWTRNYLAAESTSDVQKIKSNESSAGVKIYATAMPMHGYTFTGWTAGANTAISNGYDADYYQCAFDITSSSEDSNTPVAGVATANFIDASPISVTVLKDANRGTIAVTQKYYYLDGSSVKERSTDLTSMEASDAKRVYDTDVYPYDRLTLTATAAEDYTFYGWYTEKGNRTEFVSDQLSIAITLDESVTYYAYFDKIDADNAFMVGFYQLPTWEDALAAAKANAPCNILVLKNCSIPAGYHTLPEGVTLLIPKDANQIVAKGNKIQRYEERNSKSDWVECGITKTAYRTLTLEAGCHLDVFGTIEVGGMQDIVGQGINGVGHPAGTYGQLIVKNGATITLEDGAILRAWGFVTGDIANKDANDIVPGGEIDARRGSTVYEQFQMMDWKGGTCSVRKMLIPMDDLIGQSDENKDKKVFQVTQYFIQNIEIPTTYHPGAKLLAATGMVMSKSAYNCDDLGLVGVEYDDGSKDDALFLMANADDSEDTWVRKYYDSEHDRQVYEINNSARLGNLKITLSGYSLQSKNYILPITNNMHIHLLYGEMNITQSTNILAGAEIEVDKQATITINEGQTLYLYDNAEWGAYSYNGYYAHQILYSPIFNGKPNKRTYTKQKASDKPSDKPESSKLNIHGTFNVLGSVYTTESGANICSTNADAGTIIFSNNAPTDNANVYQVTSATPDYDGKTCIPALLRNTDPIHPTTPTAGTDAGQSFCYLNGKWTQFTVDSENECFVKDNYNNYYAKPGAYVLLANGKTENADHTYSDAAGQGRLYILMDDCQWWEVELYNNLYKGITRDENDEPSWNGKYYAYNTTTNKWEEKRYTITWKDWDGSIITTYQLTYGVTPKYNSTNPTREANLDYTYDFTGWAPAFAPVTGDQIYTATYKETPIRYTVTFKNEDGTIIERQFLTRGTVPTPPSVTNGNKILQWNPSVGAVTGDQFYTASWLDATPAKWTITWKNYNGSTLTTTTPDNEADAATVAAGAPANPTKPANSEYTYNFTGWAPTIVAATANAAYTAQYEAVRNTYTVNFYKEGTTNETKSDPENLIASRTELHMGDAVTVPTGEGTTKTATGYTYTLQWKDLATNQIVGTGVPAVAGNTDYVADFSLYTVSRYTITTTCATPSSCIITGGGVYDYGTENVSLTATANTGYEFVKWNDEEDGNTDNPRIITVTGNKTYTAVVRPVGIDVPVDASQTISRATAAYNIVLHSDGTNSSQILGGENLSVADEGVSAEQHAFFDLTRETGKVFKNHTWYAFSVPFRVNAANILFDGEKLQYNQESKKDAYDILYYNGEDRANNGSASSNWAYVENDEGENKYLYPGKLYMIAITKRDVTTIRFTKDGGNLLTTSVSVAPHAQNTGSDKDANWNGVANPALFHADMSELGSTENIAWIYNPDASDPTNPYVTTVLTGKKVVLGQAFFVQTSDAKSLVVEPATSGSSLLAAPARSRKYSSSEEDPNRYMVKIAKEDGRVTDFVIVRADEEKEKDKYVLGKDLVHMGMSSILPQLWVNRYDAKLIVNAMMPYNDQTDYPLGIFAPEYGDYTIYTDAPQNEETSLYLTLDGELVWNLSNGEYVLTLDKGTYNNYGLRIAAKGPQVVTGIEEAIIDAQGSTQKVLINNQVFIIRGNKVYTTSGIIVK